jgi:adenylosuccinate synthase
MKRATAVIGAAFGDEGKGLLTDYFCRRAGEEPWCVRFNGGAQAGHTVVTPDGDRHVFHHFGAGTLAGARTYLSRHFLINPVVWRTEFEELQGRGLRTRLFVDREAPITTVWDMLHNRNMEAAAGSARHGSCGMGVHATMVRQVDPEERLFAGDLERPAYLRQRVQRIMGRRGFAFFEGIFDHFILDCEAMASQINLCDSRVLVDRPADIVFEGAQGLLLDQDSKFYPHVTHSKTGIANVMEIARETGINQIDAVYVHRSYLTRHGAGPLPGEDPSLSYPDDTNVENEWQGKLRFAPMQPELISNAVFADYSVARYAADINVTPLMAQTHCDQWTPQHTGNMPHFVSHGPTHRDVYDLRKR